MNNLEYPKLFTIYDVKIESYSELICTDADALQQMLHVMVNTHGSGPQHTYSEDFIVYEIGEWQEGNVYLLPEKKIHLNLAGLKKPCQFCKKEANNT